jgi:hypothetical protein
MPPAVTRQRLQKGNQHQPLYEDAAMAAALAGVGAGSRLEELYRGVSQIETPGNPDWR